VSPAPYRIAVAPRRAPDLAQATALYTTHCGVCHGTAGRGDGPAARGMDPPPSNFTDRGRMDQRSASLAAYRDGRRADAQVIPYR
jgi:high-affinity iron transporter